MFTLNTMKWCNFNLFIFFNEKYAQGKFFHNRKEMNKLNILSVHKTRYLTITFYLSCHFFYALPHDIKKRFKRHQIQLVNLKMQMIYTFEELERHFNNRVLVCTG